MIQMELLNVLKLTEVAVDWQIVQVNSSIRGILVVATVGITTFSLLNIYQAYKSLLY